MISSRHRKPVAQRRVLHAGIGCFVLVQETYWITNQDALYTRRKFRLQRCCARGRAQMSGNQALVRIDWTWDLFDTSTNPTRCFGCTHLGTSSCIHPPEAEITSSVKRPEMWVSIILITNRCLQCSKERGKRFTVWSQQCEWPFCSSRQRLWIEKQIKYIFR